MCTEQQPGDSAHAFSISMISGLCGEPQFADNCYGDAKLLTCFKATQSGLYGIPLVGVAQSSGVSKQQTLVTNCVYTGAALRSRFACCGRLAASLSPGTRGALNVPGVLMNVKT